MEEQDKIIVGMIKLTDFIYNYDNGFIEQVWGKDTAIAKHLESKYNNLTNKHGDIAGLVWFIRGLDQENTYALFQYINRKYEKGGMYNLGGKLNKTYTLKDLWK